MSLSAVANGAWSAVETPGATLAVETATTISAAPERLQQLLENLFRNAVEQGGPFVTVRVEALPGWFYIEDDGRHGGLIRFHTGQ